MVEGLIVYDADLPKEELIRKGILESVPFGAGKLLSYNAVELLNYTLSRLAEDELYLLKDSSRAKIAELRRSKPYPFKFEYFEGEGA